MDDVDLLAQTGRQTSVLLLQIYDGRMCQQFKAGTAIRRQSGEFTNRPIRPLQRVRGEFDILEPIEACVSQCRKNLLAEIVIFDRS